MTWLLGLLPFVGHLVDWWPLISGAGTLLGLGASALIPGLGPVFVFVRANWRWLVPVVLIVALGLDDFRLRAKVAGLQRDAAELALKQQQAVLEQKERDRVLAGQLMSDRAEENARLDKTVERTIERIRYVPVTTDCALSPAMRAADDGLLELGFPRAPGPATGADAPTAATPGSRPRRRGRQGEGRGAHALRSGLPQARRLRDGLDLLHHRKQGALRSDADVDIAGRAAVIAAVLIEAAFGGN